MASSSPVKVIMKELVAEFSKNLRELLQLHLDLQLVVFYDDDKITEVASREKAKAIVRFKEAVSNLYYPNQDEAELEADLMNKFCLELEKEIEARRVRNALKKKKYLVKRVDDFCEDFIEFFEALLACYPNMSSKEADDSLKARKLLTIDRYEAYKNVGDRAFYEMQLKNLEESLDQLKTTMMENINVQGKNSVASCSLEEVKALKPTLLQMLKELKINFGDHVTKQDLKSTTCKVEEYWVGMSDKLLEHHLKLYFKIFIRIKRPLDYFQEQQGEHASLEDAVGWAEWLHNRIDLCLPKEDDKVAPTPVPHPEEDTRTLDATESVVAFTEAPSAGPTELDTVLVEVEASMRSFALNDDDDYDVHMECTDAPEEITEQVVLPQELLNAEMPLESGTITTMNTGRGDVFQSPRVHPFVPSAITTSPIARLSGRMIRKPLVNVVEAPDINLPDENGEYTLLRAIRKGESVTCIKKMLESGANVNIKTIDMQRNAVIEAIRSFSNEMMKRKRAMDVLDLLVASGFNLINDRDSRGLTVFHHAMEMECLDEEISKWLIMNGADFEALSNEGFAPLVHGLKRSNGNPFPALINLKDVLPITEEMASAALTAIVDGIEKCKGFLETSFEGSAFAAFITFLIEEKGGLIQLKNEELWKEEDWEGVGEIMLDKRFLMEVRKKSGIILEGEINGIQPTTHRNVDVYADPGSSTVLIEIALVSLLESKKDETFVKVCGILRKFI